MRGSIPALALVFAIAYAQGAAAQASSAVSFVACPIARDTGPDTDLCFIAEYAGRRYALVNPPDWGAPQLLHKVLVEGRVTGGPDVCGATALEGRVSVLAEIDASCDQVLPFDGSVRGAPGGIFNSGTPAQRAYALDLARRAEADPKLSVAPVMPDAPAAPPPAPPSSRQTLTIYFPFDSERGSGPDMAAVVKLADYAKASKAKVAITGYAGASRLSDGATLTERQALAHARAAKLYTILVGLGVDARAVNFTTAEAGAPTGDEDWRRRRVVITVTP